MTKPKWEPWRCHARPAMLGGKVCGAPNTKRTLYNKLEVCAACGATKIASDARKERER